MIEAKKHTLITGPTGSGKSFLSGAMVEQLYINRRPFVLFDTKQVNHAGLLGLKGTKLIRVDANKSYDFEKALQHDYLILIPTARTRTRALVEIYEQFLDILYDTHAPRTIILEEAHQFQKAANVPNETVELLTREGRGYDQNLWFITQRIQDFPKLLWAQCHLSYILKQRIPHDIRYISDIIPHFDQINPSLDEHDIIRFNHANSKYSHIRGDQVRRSTQHLG